DLTGAEAHEGVGLDADGLCPEARDDLGGRPKEQVPDQDRGRVVVGDIGAGDATTQLRLIHYVVVVERGQVGQLHPDGSVDHSGPGGDVACVRPYLRGQERQHRPEPFAPSVAEVACRPGDELVV